MKYFWAVLAKNAPGDFPAKDYFLAEIRPDTEFKQDRKHNMKEFTFTTSKVSLSFLLETPKEQQMWMEGFRRAFLKANLARRRNKNQYGSLVSVASAESEASSETNSRHSYIII